jgi:hypothetical protein
MGLNSPDIRNVFQISGLLSVYGFIKGIQLKDLVFLKSIL